MINPLQTRVVVVQMVAGIIQDEMSIFLKIALGLSVDGPLPREMAGTVVGFGNVTAERIIKALEDNATRVRGGAPPVAPESETGLPN